MLQVLLDAAVMYDERSQQQPERLPPLLIVITGKGPDKAAYMQQLSSKTFERLALRTAWLEASDYPVLLACADLGVSLHASSSDLDLPMKVSDMLGWCAMASLSCGHLVVVHAHLWGCVVHCMSIACAARAS